VGHGKGASRDEGRQEELDELHCGGWAIRACSSKLELECALEAGETLCSQPLAPGEIAKEYICGYPLGIRSNFG
jgi:hypothetical protein